MQKTVKKVSMAGRIMDLGLAVLWVYLALHSETSGWRITFWVFAAFCLFTAATAPIDKLFAIVNARMFSKRKG